MSLTCEDFLNFLVNKIMTIRSEIVNCNLDPSVPTLCSATFTHFELVSLVTLTEIVGRMKSTNCPLDSIPSWLFKKVFDIIGPNILSIINGSLHSGLMPLSLKQAVVQPLLKKPNLDHSVLSNFRPISKLPFLSKVLEKIVLSQLQSFLDQNVVLESFQSGFKVYHSTESALLKVLNDILLLSDSGHSVVLMLLDLTAAFDTIDHGILALHLEEAAGIQGTALKWFR